MSKYRVRMAYFGCFAGSPRGHEMIVDPMVSFKEGRDFLNNNPWGLAVDGGLAPTNTRLPGLCLLWQKDGWTAMSFWDNTGDPRAGSVSVFLAQGTFDFDEMCMLSETRFREIRKHMRFSLSLHAPILQGAPLPQRG